MNDIMYDTLCPRDVTMSVTVYYLLTANNEVIDRSMNEGVQMNKITKVNTTPPYSQNNTKIPKLWHYAG